ncbi:hypothetical protein [Halomarina oriensis]|uniref:Right-handed parallel beta-helix repeat-containing protein n=1 Tax=Halomarina oriensis TaxID=671145 RepID=A0A6B0GWK1_9EURY|nr:hypothetical protein [Halomarina oriensis]MWG36953.1 hypothetical protein [Halomarina oriensis]
MEDRPVTYSKQYIRELETENHNAEQLETELLSGKWAGKVLVFQDGSVSSIDPSATETPVQDALDVIGGGAGAITIPPGGVDEAAPVDVPDGGRHQLSGFGTASRVSTPASAIRFTSSGSTSHHGFILGDFNDDFTVRDVAIDGPGADVTTGDALHFTGSTRSPRFENVNLRNWGRDGIGDTDETDVKPFEMQLDGVGFWNIAGGGINLADNGVCNHATSLRFHDVGFLIDLGSGDFNIDTVNVGGSVTSDVQGACIRTTGSLRIGHINFEPAGTVDTADGIVLARFDGNVRIESVMLWNVTMGYVYRGDDPSSNWFGPAQVKTNSGATLTDNVVNLTGSVGDELSFYEGSASDVTSNVGTTALVPLADLSADYGV